MYANKFDVSNSREEIFFKEIQEIISKYFIGILDIAGKNLFDVEMISQTPPSSQTGESQILIPKDDTLEKRKSENNEERIIKVEKVLKDSFDENEETPVHPSMNTIEECIKSIIILENNIRCSGKKQIHYYVEIGKNINFIKQKEKTRYMNALRKNGIKYSQQHSNLLMKLFHLFDKHQHLYKSSASLRFFKINFKVIQIICERNNW